MKRGGGYFSHILSPWNFGLLSLDFFIGNITALKFAIIRLHENDYFSRVKSNKFRLADYCSNRLVRIRWAKSLMNDFLRDLDNINFHLVNVPNP